MSDILTRLLLNTSDYDSKLKRAKGSTQDFASTIVGTATGAVMKLAGALTAVAGSAMTFESVIRGSQTTSDEFDRVVRSVTSTVESFFTAVSTGDFTAFNRGLDDIIARARMANDALDQLGNTTMSYGYFNARNQADFAEAITVLRDKNATAAEKEAAKATADRIMGSQKEITEQMRRRSEEAVAALVTEGNTLGLNNIKRLDIDKVLGLDVSAMGSEQKAALTKRYQEYVSLFNREMAKPQYKIKTISNVSGFGYFEQETTDKEAVAEAMKEVTNEYQDAILYNEILVRKSDDWLQNLINIYQASDNAVRGMASMERQLNRASQAGTGGSGGTSGGKAGTKKADAMPVIVPQIQYDTPIGKKMLEAMNGKKFEPIEIPIVIEDDVQEEDLSGAWEKHLEKIKKMNESLSDTGEIFNGLGSIMSSFGNDMGAWIMNSIGSVANMIVELQSLATARGVAEAASKPFPFNLAAMATVVTTVASIFASLPKFADGGIVGGSSFFGDKLLARVNSGEMILNQGQQARLLSLTEGGNVRVSGDVRLNGKDIYISLRNYMASSGNKL